MLPVKKGINRLLYDLIFCTGFILIVLGLFLLVNFTNANEEFSGERDYSLTAGRSKVYTQQLKQSIDNWQGAPEDGEIKVIIPPGSTGIMIAKLLEEKGLMESEDFQKLMTLFEIERRLKAGEYTFHREDSQIDVLDKILVK